ncbi:MAG TPA: hypothetical protein DEB46_14155 [Myxococcales bacterium]|nr:hypothetical protein [Myxococcales bacterium]HBU49445.1 hypothetical protein [Myxococcales bacterium]|tara:strand:- start:4233 stop:4529 length:297 start_codon:yes stop_codon:yes gene_type:complete
MTVVERMRDLLQRERAALRAGDPEQILACASEKEGVLVELIDTELSQAEAQELGDLNRFNGELARGGASLLRAVLGQDRYGPDAQVRAPAHSVIDRQA